MVKIKVEPKFGFNASLLDFGKINPLTVKVETSNETTLKISQGGNSLLVKGNFTAFDDFILFKIPKEGTVTDVVLSKAGATAVSLSALTLSVEALRDALDSESPAAVLALLNANLGGADNFTGGDLTDVFDGFGGNDTIIGNKGADKLFGGAGNDKIFAGLLLPGASDAAFDFLTGGKGDDFFYTDSLTDKVFEKVGEGSDTVVARGSFALTAGAEVEFIFADAPAAKTAVNLTGNEFAQQISGNAGNNIINGKGGSDYLRGEKQGFDSAGKDIFVFDTALNDTAKLANGKADLNRRNIDKLNEFQPGEDKIALDNAIFKKLVAAGALSFAPGQQVGLKADFFKDLRDVKAGTAKLDANDFVQYDVARGLGTLYYDADGSGAGLKVAFAEFTNASKIDLSHTDFIVI